MRRITWWLLSTVAALVLLFSYRTSTGAGAIPAAIGNGSTVDGQPVTSGGGSGSRYDGSVAQTRWGPVQVTITVDNGKITNVGVPTYPNGNGRDRQINAYALPILQRETLSAQNANIDTVSGATVTSDGYRRSLQAALDSAHLG